MTIQSVSLGNFSPPSAPPFFSLPQEIQFHIFTYLRPEELLNLARVSRSMRTLAIRDSSWEYFYKQEINPLVPQQKTPLRDSVIRVWKQTAAQLLPTELQNQAITKKRKAYQILLDVELSHKRQRTEAKDAPPSVISQAVSISRRCPKSVITHLLAQGSQIDSGKDGAPSSFDFALKAKQPVATLKMLVQHGAEPDRSTAHSSLDIAIESGCPDETIGYLLYTLNCLPTSFSFKKALEARQSLSVIEMLEKRQAIIFPDALNCALENGCSYEVVHHFIDFPLTQAGEGGPSSLDLAIRGKCSLQTVQLIWEKGIRLTPTPTERNSRVFSTLDAALFSGAPVEVIDFLLEQGAQPTLAGNQPMSSFQQALMGHYSLKDLQHLYQKGITDGLDATSPSRSPFEIGRSFSIAIEEGLPEETLLWMIEIGIEMCLEATMNSRTEIYSTLDRALKKGYGIKVIRAFVEKGCVLRPAGIYGLVGGPMLLSSMECARNGNCSEEVLSFIAEKTQNIS